jgi:hypothetical protein
MDSALLTERLGSDRAEDRAAALAEIEAIENVALASATVAPLVALLGRPQDEIGASELQRSSLALGHLVSLDCATVGAELFRDGRWLTCYTSQGNALNHILSKPTAELTRADALVCAACESPICAAQAKGMDVVLHHAGLTGADYFGGIMMNPHSPVNGTDERNNRLSTLVVDALREQREQLAEGMVAGAWWMLAMLNLSRPATCLHQMEIGSVGLVVAELRRSPSSDWVDVSRCPSGRVFMTVTCNVFMNQHDDPGTPGLLEVYLDILAAYERMGPSQDTSSFALFNVGSALYNSGLFDYSEANAASMRKAAPSIRFILDHPPPHDYVSDLHLNSSMIFSFLAVHVFGRDEGDTMQLRQDDIDNVVGLLSTFHLDISLSWFPLPALWSECMLSLSVSDHHKLLLLENLDAIPHLISGLFLDPDHPHGLRAKEVLQFEAAAPTPLDIQAVYQQNYTEALEQLALFAPGKEALLRDEAAVAALETVVKQGMTDEAKEHARGALMALRGIDEDDDVAVPTHIMLSYLLRPTFVQNWGVFRWDFYGSKMY